LNALAPVSSVPEDRDRPQCYIAHQSDLRHLCGKQPATARIVGYKVVPGLPLVLLVSYTRAAVLASWYQHLYPNPYVIEITL
jgi:hypothetical protein